jgi:hypothetical protein
MLRPRVLVEDVDVSACECTRMWPAIYGIGASIAGAAAKPEPHDRLFTDNAICMALYTLIPNSN